MASNPNVTSFPRQWANPMVLVGLLPAFSFALHGAMEAAAAWYPGVPIAALVDAVMGDLACLTALGAAAVVAYRSERKNGR